MVYESKDILFDTRIYKRNIKDKKISKKEFENHLASLKDQEGNYEDISEDVYSTNDSKVQVAGDYLSDDNDDNDL